MSGWKTLREIFVSGLFPFSQIDSILYDIAASVLQHLRANLNLPLHFALVGQIPLQFLLGLLTLLLFKLLKILSDMLTERSVLLILRKTVLMLHLYLPIKHRLHLHRLLFASILVLNMNSRRELLIEAISADKLLDETILFNLSLTDCELICHVVDDDVLLGSPIVSFVSHSVRKIFADDVIAEGTLGIIFSSLLYFV
jgi:hypothetical protein